MAKNQDTKVNANIYKNEYKKMMFMIWSKHERVDMNKNREIQVLDKEIYINEVIIFN